MSKIKIYNAGKEIYSGDCYSNMAILKGFISGEIRKVGSGCAKLSLRLSNGKDDKTGEWRPSTFADCTAFREEANITLENYKDGDTIWILGKFYSKKVGDKYFKGFHVRNLINIPNDKKEAHNSQNEVKTVRPDDFYDDLPFLI